MASTKRSSRSSRRSRPRSTALTLRESNALWTLDSSGPGAELWLTARECNVPEAVLVGLRDCGYVATRRDKYRITTAGRRALQARAKVGGYPYMHARAATPPRFANSDNSGHCRPHAFEWSPRERCYVCGKCGATRERHELGRQVRHGNAVRSYIPPGSSGIWTDGGADVREMTDGELRTCHTQAWNLSNMHDLQVTEKEAKRRGLPWKGYLHFD